MVLGKIKRSVYRNLEAEVRDVLDTEVSSGGEFNVRVEVTETSKAEWMVDRMWTVYLAIVNSHIGKE